MEEGKTPVLVHGKDCSKNVISPLMQEISVIA
jgi:hypothetical protein